MTKERTGSLSYRVQVHIAVWKRYAEQLHHKTDTSDGDVSKDAPELITLMTQYLADRAFEIKSILLD